MPPATAVKAHRYLVARTEPCCKNPLSENYWNPAGFQAPSFRWGLLTGTSLYIKSWPTCRPPFTGWAALFVKPCESDKMLLTPPTIEIVGFPGLRLVNFFQKKFIQLLDGVCDTHKIDNVTEISLICHSSYTSWKKDRCPYWVSVLFLFEDSRRLSAFYIDLSHGMWTSDSRRKGWLHRIVMLISMARVHSVNVFI